jgi:hypothetical protein
MSNVSGLVSFMPEQTVRNVIWLLQLMRHAWH